MFSKDTLAFMDAAVDAVIAIDHRGSIAALNKSTQRLFGYAEEELLGKNISILMPEPDRRWHDQYMRQYQDSGIAKIIGIGREVLAQRKDGTLFPARLSVGEVPDSEPPRFVGLLRDVTAEHSATAELRLARDRANAYLELNDAILLKLDPDHCIAEINARGGDLLGAPRETIQGWNWLQLMDGADECERARQMLVAARAGGSCRELELDTIDFRGEHRRIVWRCIAMAGADGSLSGWLISGADVTERLRREEMAALAHERVTRVARMATMGEMASGLAHELNQPLTAITTYARACERFLAMPEPDFSELQLAVREIGAEGMRAGKIIDRLRQLVKSDEPELPEALDINSVVEELRTLLEIDARLFAARIEFSLAGSLPRVDGNAVQLQQLLLNLVRNSFEALAEVHSSERVVQLATRLSEDGQIEIAVTDNGPGFPPALIGRLFHPFITTKKSGTGLGLAMSRTIALNHGGSIGIRNQAPPSACVFVRLPAREDKAWMP